MLGSKQQLVTTLTCAFIALTTMGAVANSQIASAPARPAPAQSPAAQVAAPRDTPAVMVAAPTQLEKRNAVIKLEIVRTQVNGDKDIEAETYKGLVGSRITSTGISARNYGNILRSVRTSVREVRDGLIYLDLDFDEGTQANRDAYTPDRQFSTSVAVKDGETVLLKSLNWKSNPVKSAQSDGKETNMEQMVFATVHIEP